MMLKGRSVRSAHRACPAAAGLWGPRKPLAPDEERYDADDDTDVPREVAGCADEAEVGWNAKVSSPSNREAPVSNVWVERTNWGDS
jgi:hypothetical protein